MKIHISYLMNVILPISIGFFSLIGSLITIWAERKRIKLDPLSGLSRFTSHISPDADPTPFLRERNLYAPYNRKIGIIFKIGVTFLILAFLCIITQVTLFVIYMT